MTSDKKKNFHVVYLGQNGFPIGFGAMQKMILISKALIATGAKVTVINRKGKFDPSNQLANKIKPDGIFEGIHYCYTGGSIYRPKGFLKRNWMKLHGSWGEFKYLWKLKKNNDIQAAIISSYSFIHVFLYTLYSRIMGFPVIFNYVEKLSALEDRHSLKEKINDYWFEKLLIPAMDAALPISALLEKDFAEIAPSKPMLKVPIICDFEKFEVKAKKNNPHFLYCGAIAYRSVIDFVIDSFEAVPEHYQMELHLVIGSDDEVALQQLQSDIKISKRAANIKLFVNVPHHEIPSYFKGANALLIPLRPTIQDAARFPHKIGEYLATKNPVITTDVGEICSYFTNDKDALIASAYDPLAFAKKMEWVVAHPEQAQKIGAAGYQLGLHYFNYLSYGDRLYDFIKALEANCSASVSATSDGHFRSESQNVQL